jgi:hypothetical protein
MKISPFPQHSPKVEAFGESEFNKIERAKKTHSISEKLGRGLRLEHCFAVVETATCASSVKKLCSAAIRAIAETWCVNLVMCAAFIATRSGISVCWIWHSGSFVLLFSLTKTFNFACFEGKQQSFPLQDYHESLVTYL